MGADKKPTVAEYAVGRLGELGIRHVFGVPGDFSFPIDDAIADHPALEWVVSSNELNAAYAADGYARVHGAAMLTTTYGVGELSALNGVMGSKAEHVTVFHLVGAPSTRSTRAGLVLHHSLGDGVTGQFFGLSAASACASTSLTPRNCVAEMERVIAAALENRQPAYIQIPMDIGPMEILGDAPPAGVVLAEVPPPRSEPAELSAALEAVRRRVASARKPVVLAAFSMVRFGLQAQLRAVLDATGIPFAVTPMDKCVALEDHPGFLGVYKGAGSAAAVREAVEGADLVLDLGGVVFDDLSTGYSTARLSRDALVTVAPSTVTMTSDAAAVHSHVVSYSPVWMGDVLAAMVAGGLHPGAKSCFGKRWWCATFYTQANTLWFKTTKWCCSTSSLAE